MKIDKMSEKIFEEYKKQELNRQEFLTGIMKPTYPYERETQLNLITSIIDEIERI